MYKDILNTLEKSFKSPKRKGRGPGSGSGGTSTRGHKGQNARSGSHVKQSFEGGQTPIYRRFPKRGFTSDSKKIYKHISLSDLLNIYNSVSNADLATAVFSEGLMDATLFFPNKKIRVLSGNLSTESFDKFKITTIKAHHFSASVLKQLQEKNILILYPEKSSYVEIK